MHGQQNIKKKKYTYYLGSFFLDLEDIRELVMGATRNFAEGTGPL